MDYWGSGGFEDAKENWNLSYGSLIIGTAFLNTSRDLSTTPIPWREVMSRSHVLVYGLGV